MCAKDLDCNVDNICGARRGDLCIRWRIGNNNDDDKDEKKTLSYEKGTKCIGTRSIKQ